MRHGLLVREEERRNGGVKYRGGKLSLVDVYAVRHPGRPYKLCTNTDTEKKKSFRHLN